MSILNFLKSSVDRKETDGNEDDYMYADELENAESVQIYWDDLTDGARQRIIDLFGDNGNYDIIPIAEIWKGAD